MQFKSDKPVKLVCGLSKCYTHSPLGWKWKKNENKRSNYRTAKRFYSGNEK